VRIKNEELRMRIDRDRIWRHFSTLFRDSVLPNVSLIE